MTPTLLLAIGLLCESAPGEPAAHPAPVIPTRLSLRLDRPDVQLERFLGFLKGMKAADGAAALSLYKTNKSRIRGGLPKAAEAGLAAFNPHMIRELKTLHGTVVRIQSQGEKGMTWLAAIPGDDGTYEAVATALSLTGGAQIDPLDGQPVDRLGPEGAPLMSRGKGGLGAIIGPTREALLEARGILDGPAPAVKSDASRIVAVLEPAPPRAEDPLTYKRVLKGLVEAGCQRVELTSGIEGEEFRVSVLARYQSTPWISKAKIDPDWLLPTAANELAAAFCFAVDPSPQGWNSLFSWLEGVEKADPARAGLAPLRLRVALITGGTGFRPETELYPHLRGISAYAFVGEGQPVGSGLVGLHFANADKARSFVETTLPRVSKQARQGEPRVAADGTRSWPELGSLGPVSTRAVGSTVWLGWQPGSLDRLKPKSEGAASAWLKETVSSRPNCQRLLVARPNAAFEFLPSASAILWLGTGEGAETRDEIRWTDLRGCVRATIDRFFPENP